MMSFFASKDSWRSENFGMFCGPVRIAARICCSLAGSRSGAYLPEDSAPPLPVKVWQGGGMARTRARAAQRFHRRAPLRVAHRVGAAAVGLLVSAQRVDLRLVEDRLLARRLG